MESHNHNLNIHYTMPKEMWDQLGLLYEKMPHWNGYVGGIPTWYQAPDQGAPLIWASVEPSGLQFYAELPSDEWDQWFTMFKAQASEILGFAVGEPEDGFEFILYSRNTSTT